MILYALPLIFGEEFAQNWNAPTQSAFTCIFLCFSDSGQISVHENAIIYHTRVKIAYLQKLIGFIFIIFFEQIVKIAILEYTHRKISLTQQIF